MNTSSFSSLTSMYDVAKQKAKDTLTKVQEKVAAGADSSIASLSSKTSCYDCKVQVYDIMVSSKLHQCGICTQLYCKTCISKDHDFIPEDLLSTSVKCKDNKYKWICNKTCKLAIEQYRLKELKDALRDKISRNFNAYKADEKVHIFFELPKVIEDSYERKAIRMARLLEAGISYTSFDMYFKAAKLVYYGTEFYKLLVDSEVMNALKPIIENLQVYNVINPKDYRSLLRVYYLTWKHQLDAKCHPNINSIHSKAGDPGIINEKCPQALLDYVGEHIDASHWLYMSKLHSPHDNEAMRSWYLCRLVLRSNWTVLVCVNDATKMSHTSRKIPAFALMVRLSPSTGEKEAVLSICGSKSAMDWSINLSEEPIKYIYVAGKGTKDQPYHNVDGYVHAGMLDGAVGILEDYNIIEYLGELSSLGYIIKVVGHSLGCGTATLIAAEAKKYFVRLRESELDHIKSANSSDKDPPIADDVNRREITSIGYGPPPMVSEEISDAMSADELCISVVLNDDAVPRFSRSNVIKLAAEVSEFAPIADKWYDKDYADLTKYMKTYMKASDPSLNMDHEGSTNSSNASTSLAPSTSATPTAIATPIPAAIPAVMPAAMSELVEATLVDESYDMVIDGVKVAPSAMPSDTMIPLVPPGKIIFIYSINSCYHAALCDHHLTTLKSLKLLAHSGLEDHKITSYWESLRNLKYASMDKVNVGRSSDYKSIIRSADASVEVATLVTSATAVNEDHVIKAVEAAVSVSDTGPNATTSSVVATSVHVSAYLPCTVCQLDCTWSYISHSEATRAAVTHTCSVCGMPVCSVCAPAGDSIPGDGLNESIQLDDMRIASPSFSIFSPKRVCMHCYLDSYRVIDR